MPVITLEGSRISSTQKEALIQRLTKTASEIMQIPEQAFVVLLKENDPDNIGTGGEVLTKVLAKQNQK